MGSSALLLHMRRQFRKECAKVVGKGGFMFLEDRKGAGQIEGAAESPTDASENIRDTGHAVIGGKPVLFAHAEKWQPGLRQNRGQTGFDIAIHLADEMQERNLRIGRPITGQKMVKVHIGKNASVAAEGRRKSPDAGPEPGMDVGKRINPVVAADASLIPIRKNGQAGRGSEIRQKITNPEFRIGLGQVQMGQPVHLPGKCRSLPMLDHPRRLSPTWLSFDLKSSLSSLAWGYRHRRALRSRPG